MLSKKQLKYAFIILSGLAIVAAIILNYHHFSNTDHPTAVANESSSDSVENQSNTSDDEPSNVSRSEVDVSELDETSVYEEQLMIDYGIEHIDPSDYTSAEELIYALIDAHGINPDQISIAYTHLETDESFYLNETMPRIAGSLYKVPLVAMYLDLIENQTYSYETQVPFNEAYFIEGGGNITNSPLESSYSVDALIYETIVHSDNTAAWTLLFNHFASWSDFQSAILDFVGYYDVPDYYYSDNYLSASMMEDILHIIISDPTYDYLVELMSSSEPHQLFTSYVGKGMANKYGRFDTMVNDAGIYYEDEEPLYTLVAMTDNVLNADIFLERLNLRLNEWSRAQNTE